MSNIHGSDETREIFETRPIWPALATMAIPTIASQLIADFLNVIASYIIYFRVIREIREE